MQFKPGERDDLCKMRVLTTDEHGQDVYAGLTIEESEAYHTICQSMILRPNSCFTATRASSNVA